MEVDFTDSGSSTHEARLKYTSPSLRGEEYFNLVSEVLCSQVLQACKEDLAT